MSDSDLRKILYTTNAIESLNDQVRKAVRVRGHFPTEEAVTKLIWLAPLNVQAAGKIHPQHGMLPKLSWPSSSRTDLF